VHESRCPAQKEMKYLIKMQTHIWINKYNGKAKTDRTLKSPWNFKMEWHPFAFSISYFFVWNIILYKVAFALVTIATKIPT
jgi:hypothetical protein